LAVGFGGLRLWTTLNGVMSEANLARDELLAGARIAKTGATGLTKEQDALAAGHFRAAEAQFAHVHAVLSEGRTIRAVAWLPWVRTQVQAANDLSDMGLHLSRAGVVGLQVVGAALEQPPPGSTGHENPGQKILETLRALDPKVGQLTAELDLALTSRARIPTSGILPQLHNAVIQLDSKVDIRAMRDGVVAFRAQEPAIQHLLGASGSQTYLVLQQDPAELRPTGGFIGSVAFLTFDHGKMSPFDPVDVATIDRDARGAILGFGAASTHVPVPAPLAKTFNLTSLALRDSNWSPDFPSSARQAEALLKIETGKTVDGVIAIDPYLIGRMLTVLGPTLVPETGDTVNADNFFATTLNRVELNPAANRKSFLSYAAKAIFAKLLVLPPAQWLPLLPVLSWGCDGHSLQAYFHDPQIESLVHRYRCGGEVEPLSSDGLMVVDSNVGGNKDDFWLQRKYALRIELNTDGSAQHTLHIHYSGLTPHGVELTKYWGYTGWLRIYLPPSSTLVNSSGAELGETSDLGRHVLQGWVYVPFYKSLDVTVVYRVGAADMHTSNGHLDLIWQKQAGRPADVASVEVTPPAGWKLTSAQVGKAQLPDPLSTDLSVDRAFAFTFRRS
jgi:hypothetical protein